MRFACIVLCVTGTVCLGQPSRVVVDNCYPSGPTIPRYTESYDMVFDASPYAGEAGQQLWVCGDFYLPGMSASSSRTTIASMNWDGEWINQAPSGMVGYPAQRFTQSFGTPIVFGLAPTNSNPLSRPYAAIWNGNQFVPFGSPTSWSGFYVNDIVGLATTLHRSGEPRLAVVSPKARDVRIFSADGVGQSYSDSTSLNMLPYASTIVDWPDADLGGPAVLIGGTRTILPGPTSTPVFEALRDTDGNFVPVPLRGADFVGCLSLARMNGRLYAILEYQKVVSPTSITRNAGLFRLEGDIDHGFDATMLGEPLVYVRPADVPLGRAASTTVGILELDTAEGRRLAVRGVTQADSGNPRAPIDVLSVLQPDGTWRSIVRAGPGSVSPNLYCGATSVQTVQSRFGRETYLFGYFNTIVDEVGLTLTEQPSVGLRILENGKIARLGRGIPNTPGLGRPVTLAADPQGSDLFVYGLPATERPVAGSNLIASDGITWRPVTPDISVNTVAFRKTPTGSEMWRGGSSLQRLLNGTWLDVTNNFASITSIITLDEGSPDGETVYVTGPLVGSTAGAILRWTPTGLSTIPLPAVVQSMVGARFADGPSLVISGKIPPSVSGIHRLTASGWVTLRTRQGTLAVYRRPEGDEVVSSVFGPERSRGGAFESVVAGLSSSTLSFNDSTTANFDDGTGPALYVAFRTSSVQILGAPSPTSLIRLRGDTWEAVMPQRAGFPPSVVHLTGITAIQNGPRRGVYVTGPFERGSITGDFNGIPADNIVCIKGMYCTADFNNSGGTPDDTDLAEFFNAWIQGSPDADTDLSGGAPDAQDIDTFLKAWLAGC